MDQVFKILLLEDVDRDAELIAYELGKAEVAFVVNRVVNRESFLQALETFRPHLILADYRLPSFDGLTALALAQEVCSGVPFIFVTEVANEELAEKSRKMRAAAFIPQDRLKRLGPKAKSAPAEVYRDQPPESPLGTEGLPAHLCAGSLIVFLAPDQRILEFSQGAERLTGWPKSEVLGKDAVALLFPGEKRRTARAMMSEVMAGMPVRSFDLPLQFQDGSQRLFRWNLSLLHDGQDRPSGIIMVGLELAEPAGGPKPPQSEAKKPTVITKGKIGVC